MSQRYNYQTQITLNVIPLRNSITCNSLQPNTVRK